MWAEPLNDEADVYEWTWGKVKLYQDDKNYNIITKNETYFLCGIFIDFLLKYTLLNINMEIFMY